MTKQQLVEYGGSIGIKLDLKHKKDDLINQLTQKSKFCTECGQDISQSNDGFCFNCGAKIEAKPNNKSITSEDIIDNTSTNNINSVNSYSSGGGMKDKFNRLNNWYTNLNTKQRLMIWILSLPTVMALVGIPWVLILIYMEFHRK